MNVGIYVYDLAEVLDFSGPFEVFSTASRVSGLEEPFHVFLIGQTGEAVTARAGYSVNPAYGFQDHPPIDLLIVAGGVHTGEMAKQPVIEWIARTAAKAKTVASVCTGAFLLAKAGVLTDQNVTTHWDDIEDLRAQFPNLTVHENRRWVDEGSIVTSAGISAGIDMSLHLVGRLHGLELADRTARRMEFERWHGKGRFAMSYCFVNLSANPGKQEESTLLAEVDGLDWGIFEVRGHDLSALEHPVSDALHALIESGKRYPPALAIARDEVRQIFGDDAPSRDEFSAAYATALREHLSRQHEAPYVMGQALLDEPGGMIQGEWYWVLEVSGSPATAVWVSSDFRTQASDMNDFDFTGQQLKRLGYVG